MPLFSANVGFLWSDRPLPDRIKAAGKAGFDAVECHFPYEYEPKTVISALKETELPMVGINTKLGKEGSNDFGVAALPGRESEAREYIDQAIDYSVAIGAGYVNVVASLTDRDTQSEESYRANLTYACNLAAKHDKTIVIEPLSSRAVQGYHLSHLAQALETRSAVAADNLKIMFDFYHAQIMSGDLERTLTENIQHLGHIQISAIHDRGEPDQGEINFPYVLGQLDKLGYRGYVGAEYKPRGSSVEEGLGWLKPYRP